MSLELLFISLLFFTVLCLFTLIKLAKRKTLLFLFIPLTIFLVGSTIYTYSDILGYPTTKELPDDFLVVSFVIDEPKAIYLWTIRDRKDIPRSYQIPYERGIHEKLVKAKQRMRARGTPGVHMLRGKKSKDNQRVIEFLVYNFIDQEFMKKNDKEVTPDVLIIDRTNEPVTENKNELTLP